MDVAGSSRHMARKRMDLASRATVFSRSKKQATNRVIDNYLNSTTFDRNQKRRYCTFAPEYSKRQFIVLDHEGYDNF
jgi:hypothetical protein